MAAAKPKAPKIQMLAPAKLKPYDKNAKLHNAAAIRYSIENFSMDQPIVVDAEMVIIKGHGRLEAAMALGHEAVPVIVRDDLTPAQVRAARIADNKSSEAPWDEALLDDELRLLDEEDFDLEGMGFDSEYLDRALGPLEDDDEDAGDEGGGEGPVADDDDDGDDGGQEFGEGLGNPVISTTIVFEDDAQHSDFLAFTRWLKTQREETTTGARLAGHARELLP